MPLDLSDGTWLERAQQDPSLRAFINAEIVRAVIDRTCAISTASTHGGSRQTITTLRCRLSCTPALPQGISGGAA